MKKCIEFNGVSKKYEVGEKAFYALNDVSFQLINMKWSLF